MRKTWIGAVAGLIGSLVAAGGVASSDERTGCTFTDNTGSHFVAWDYDLDQEVATASYLTRDFDVTVESAFDLKETDYDLIDKRKGLEITGQAQTNVGASQKTGMTLHNNKGDPRFSFRCEY